MSDSRRHAFQLGFFDEMQKIANILDMEQGPGGEWRAPKTPPTPPTPVPPQIPQLGGGAGQSQKPGGSDGSGADFDAQTFSIKGFGSLGATMKNMFNRLTNMSPNTKKGLALLVAVPMIYKLLKGFSGSGASQALDHQGSSGQFI